MATYANSVGWGYWPDRPSKPKRRQKVEVTQKAKNKSFQALAKAAEELCEAHGITILDVKVATDYYGVAVYAEIPESDEAFAKRVKQYEKDLAVWQKSNDKRRAEEAEAAQRRQAATLAAKAAEQKDLVKLIAAAMTTDPSLAKKALKIIEENK